MASENGETLSNEAQLALAHAAPNMRDPLRIFFELDARLARIVAGTTEPMLGQMRLAWWRDVLKQEAAERPQGDAVLDGIGAHWQGRSAELIPLVDAWEHMLADPPLSTDDAMKFLTQRRDALMAVFGKLASGEDRHNNYGKPAWWWACADLAANLSDPGEREMIVELGLNYDDPKGAINRSPAPDRGLAVLGAISHRALKRGGRPLMEGRGAALVAMRAALLGR